MRPSSARTALLSAGAIWLALPVSAVQAAGAQLHETGSTLLYPLFQQWVTDYAHVAPAVSISTGATGSGAGIAAAMAGHGADRQLRCLHVRSAGGAESTARQHPAGDFRADRELQHPRIEWRHA